MRFSINPSFRMSSRSVLTSASNNISFNNPSFSKTSGNGGTGATGEISDGGVIFCTDSFSWSCMQHGNPSNPTGMILCSGSDSTGKYGLSYTVTFNAGGSIACVQYGSFYAQSCRDGLIRALRQQSGVDTIIEKPCGIEAA